MNDGARFAPDGKTIAVVRAVRSPRFVMRPTLTLIDLASGSLRELAKDWDRWPNLADWTADGRQLLVTADDDGIVPVFSVDATSGCGDTGHRERCRRHAQRRGEARRQATCLHPLHAAGCAECYVVDLAKDGTPKALARLSGFAPAEEWAETEHIRTRSTDGAMIHSLITRPKGAKNSPTLLWIHGGPIGMSGDGWHCAGTRHSPSRRLYGGAAQSARLHRLRPGVHSRHLGQRVGQAVL